MASTYEIIQGLHQAAANAHDGSQYEKHSSDGKARSIGLKREEGDAVLDSRAIDGFNIKISGNLYQDLINSCYRRRCGDLEAHNDPNFLKKKKNDVLAHPIRY